MMRAYKIVQPKMKKNNFVLDVDDKVHSNYNYTNNNNLILAFTRGLPRVNIHSVKQLWL